MNSSRVEENVTQHFTTSEYLNEDEGEGECAPLVRDRSSNLISRGKFGTRILNYSIMLLHI